MTEVTYIPTALEDAALQRVVRTIDKKFSFDVERGDQGRLMSQTNIEYMRAEINSNVFLLMQDEPALRGWLCSVSFTLAAGNDHLVFDLGMKPPADRSVNEVLITMEVQ